MFIQVSRVKDAITGSYNGVPFGIHYSEEKYKEMKRLEQAAAVVKTPAELNAVLAEFKPLTVESFKDLAESKCPYIFIDKTGKFYLKLKGQVSSQSMPAALAERIIKSVEEGIDFMPLIKAWIRFLRIPQFRTNPGLIPVKGLYFASYLNRTYTDYKEVAKYQKEGFSIEKAKELATRLQTPITQEGLLVTYKVVRELTEKYVLVDGQKKKVNRWEAKSVDPDTGIVTYETPEYVEDRIFEPAVMGLGGNSFSCTDYDGVGQLGHIIRVGCIHELPSWDMVDTTDGAVARPGLHAGNLDYIKGYQADNTITLNVFIDPMHIGRFTNQGDGAVVVKKYFAYGAFDEPNRGIYHSSSYAKLNDEEYEAMLAESIKDFGELSDNIDNEINLAKNIADTTTLNP